jgi:hypothetical protein
VEPNAPTAAQTATGAASNGGGAVVWTTIATALGSAGDTNAQDELVKDAFAKAKQPEEPPTLKLEEAFLAALSEANTDVRSPIGQRLQREHRPGRLATRSSRP